MIVNSIDRFIELVIRSGLSSTPAIIVACAGFDTTRIDTKCLSELCQHLIDNGTLTRWQCDKLCSGKWKGFFLDGYCLLSHVSIDETTSTYLCKEVATGKHVAMAVTPPMHSADGQFHYQISKLRGDPSNGEMRSG